jgi:hypothetical protein
MSGPYSRMLRTVPLGGIDSVAVYVADFFEYFLTAFGPTSAP